MAVDKSSKTSDDSTELYYAEMESARNTAEDAYFGARPSLNDGQPADRELWRALFRSGFERAFTLLWNRRAVETTSDTALARTCLSNLLAAVLRMPVENPPGYATRDLTFAIAEAKRLLGHPVESSVETSEPPEQITKVAVRGERCFVLGDPGEGHSCDQMLCGSTGPHVLAWVPVEYLPAGNSTTFYSEVNERVNARAREAAQQSKATAPLGTIHASHCNFGFTGICICKNAALL